MSNNIPIQGLELYINELYQTEDNLYDFHRTFCNTIKDLLLCKRHNHLSTKWNTFMSTLNELIHNPKYNKLEFTISDLVPLNTASKSPSLQLPPNYHKFNKLFSSVPQFTAKERKDARNELPNKFLRIISILLCNLVSFNKNNSMEIDASSNNVLLQSIALFLEHLLSDSALQNRMVLFDANVCCLSLDNLIDFINTLFVIFIAHYKNTNDAIDKHWISIWKHCLIKLHCTQNYIMEHCFHFDLFDLCINRYFYTLCHLHCMMDDNKDVQTLIINIISFSLFHTRNVHHFEATLSSSKWFHDLLKTMMIHNENIVSYPAHKKRKLSDLSKLDMFNYNNKNSNNCKQKTDCTLLLFQKIEAFCNENYLEQHIAHVMDRNHMHCDVFKQLSMMYMDTSNSNTYKQSVLQMICKHVYIAFIRSWRENIRILEEKQRQADDGESTNAPQKELRQQYAFQLEYCFGYQLLHKLKQVKMDSNPLLFLQCAKATDCVFEIMYQENVYRPNLDRCKYQMNELSHDFISILKQLEHCIKSKAMKPVIEALLYRIHGLCRLNYAVIHKHIELLIICLFNEKLAAFDDIIEQIMAQIFAKYGSVYEIPLLMDAIIHLYVSKTGQIQLIRDNMHNFIVCNMVEQCWNQRALSPSQAVDVWESFLSAFRWIYTVEKKSKWIAFRAFCDCPSIWNLMAHFLNYIIIDEFNSKLCISLIDELRAYIKDLMEMLLFKQLSKILSIHSVDHQASNKKAIKPSSSVKNGLNELNKYIDDTLHMKNKLQSNITDVTLGINRCQSQINQYFDHWMNIMQERKQTLLQSLNQFEKVRVNPLYKQLEEMDNILHSYQDTKQDVITRMRMHMRTAAAAYEDSDDIYMKDITRTLSKSYRTPKLSTIPHFDRDVDIEATFESVSNYGHIYQQQVHRDKRVQNEMNKLIQEKEKEKEKLSQEQLALLHDIIYIHCILNKIYDECQTFDDSIQVQLHPKLPQLFKYHKLIYLVHKIEEYQQEMNTMMNMHCVYGLEYCVLHRIIQLFHHHVAFGIDSSNDLMQKQQKELQYFVEWIVPKLISKAETDEDRKQRLWNEIHCIHNEHQMDIFKAISFHSNKKTFIVWFKFLLTNHYKLRQNDNNNTIMQIDVLNELWFYDITHAESIITDEIIKIFHGDLNNLIDCVHYKSSKRCLQEIDDAIYKLSLSQFNFDEIKSNLNFTLNQKTKNTILETISPHLHRWCFLCDFIQCIPHKSATTKFNKVFYLCLIFDYMLIRPLTSIMDPDEEEEEDDEDMEAFKEFMDSLYLMFEHIAIVSLQAQAHNTWTKISISAADLIQIPNNCNISIPTRMQQSIIQLLFCAETHFLSTFEQPKLEPFGYKTTFVKENEWNKITKKTSVDASALDYTLRTLQSKKRRSLSVLQKRIITNCTNCTNCTQHKWNIKLLKCLLCAHSKYVESLSDFVDSIGFGFGLRFDLNDKLVEMWRNKECQLYVAPQSLMIMKDGLNIFNKLMMTNDVDDIITDIIDIFQSICVLLHISRESVTVHHQLNEEYAYSEWNESVEEHLNTLLQWTQSKLLSPQTAADTNNHIQYAQFLQCLSRCAMSLKLKQNEHDSLQIYTQIVDIALRVVSVPVYSGSELCHILIDSVIICCTKSKQITDYILKKVKRANPTTSNMNYIWCLLKILQSMYNNTDKIYSGAPFDIDWFDAIHSKILHKYKAICQVLNKENVQVSFAILDCFNALIHEQSFISLKTKQLAKVIACISMIIESQIVSLSLYNKLSHVLISIMFKYKPYLRDISAYFYLLMRKMITIALHHIQNNDNVLFIEECSRMLCILMMRPKKEEKGEDRNKRFHIGLFLENKHVLIVHCDQLLLQFVEFINKFPIQNAQKRILMPAIYAIIDNLMCSNMKKTGNCIDQILFSLPKKLKPTLKDIYSSYHQSKKAQRQT